MSLFTAPLTKHEITIPLVLAIIETLGGLFVGVGDFFTMCVTSITSAGFRAGAGMVLIRRRKKPTGGDVAFLSVGWLLLVLVTELLMALESKLLPLVGWHGLIPVRFRCM